MKRSWISGMCLAAALLMLLSACGAVEDTWSPINDGNVIKIAIIGDEGYIRDNGGMEAVELAGADFFERTGITIEPVIYDDQADYNLAISLAREIAEDPTIAAVIVKQELDYIDSTADIFENAQKPFIVTAGCYEHTVDRGYRYMLVDCINAQAAGEIMADYVAGQGYQYAAFCHSDTEYEEDELKSFQSALSGTSVRLADTMVGPYTQEEFDIAYARWLALGVDVICISDYYMINSNLVRLLREKGSNIPVVGDYMMDSDENIVTNGRYLNGTAIVGMYVNGLSGSDPNVTGRYEAAYGMEMSEKAVLSYDIISMLGECIYAGVDTPEQLVESMRSLEDYQGISGKLAFDGRGCLVPNGNEMLVFSDGAFRQISQ